MEKQTVEYLLLITITLAVAFVITYVLRKLLGIFISKYAKKLNTNPTNFSFIKNSVGFVIFSVAVIFIFFKIPYLKSLGTALFAGAGVVALIIGFASQKAFANIISGIFILLFKPFRIGDIIEFSEGKKGVVEEITLRHIIISDFENRRIIIPNANISEETIINSSINDERIRKHIIFGISYDSNIDLAIKIIQEEAGNHPYLLDNRTEEDIKNKEPKVLVRVVALNDFSVDLKAYTWADSNERAFVLQCDLLKSVKERFDKEGIEIPFPYRTIVFKKDEKNEIPIA